MELTRQVRILNEHLPNSSPRMFDDVSGVLYWDDINNQAYYKILKEMRGNFWVPDEVSMSQDIQNWTSEMSYDEQELYKDGIGVLVSLDSVATVFDSIAADFIRDSAIKANMAFIGAMETIHNESYTYTISSLVPKNIALEVFEKPKVNPFVVKRNRLIMDKFETFLETRSIEDFIKGLVAMSGLEGLCFVNGFTPFYHLNRNNKMFGTGTIIQFIQRDEAQHTYFQTILVRDILSQYPEYNTPELANFIYDFFRELVQLEQDFCVDLYKNIPGIDIEEVKQYVEFRANLILDSLGLDKIFSVKKNPMPWITSFDPDNLNNSKSDFFEVKEVNYVKASEADNGWGDL